MDFGLGNAKRKEHLLCWVQSLHSPSNTFQRLFIEWLSCRFRLLYWGVLGFSAVLQHLGDWLYFKLHYISLPCPWPCHIVVIQRSRELKCFLLFLTYAHQKLSVTHHFYPWGLWMKAGNTPQTEVLLWGPPRDPSEDTHSKILLYLTTSQTFFFPLDHSAEAVFGEIPEQFSDTRSITKRTTVTLTDTVLRLG